MTDNRTYGVATFIAELRAKNKRLTAELADVQSALNLSEHLRQQQATELDRLTAELDAANRRADDAVAAYHVIAARLCGMGWWC